MAEGKFLKPPPIDPRRYNVKSLGEISAYGGPPASMKRGTGGPSTADSTEDNKSPPMRYEGALREFSNKLPERGSFYKYNWRALSMTTTTAGGPTAMPTTTTALLRLYHPPWHNNMNEVKKYNAPNFNKLVKARNESNDMDVMSRYEHQIRACVREPDSYTATWELLESLCVSPKSLIRHITSEHFMNNLSPEEQANVLHLVSTHANTASTSISVGATLEELTIEDEQDSNGEPDVHLVLNPADVKDDSSEASISNKYDDEETQSTTSTVPTSSKDATEEGTESSDSTEELNSNSDED